MSVKKLLFLFLIPTAALFADESVSSNPAAVTVYTGTGELGEKLLGLKSDSGVRLGAALVSDYNYLFAGGLKPHHGGGNNLFQLSLILDTEKLCIWRGGLFGVEFLQFNGSGINRDAGGVQNYNSLPALPPHNRSELYQLWFQQTLFHKKLLVRIGKSVPSIDFNNVIRPIPLKETGFAIPATTGLIYTPIFVNSSMLGVLPGYYDSAWGVTVNFLPTKHLYFSYGFYDGNLARRVPTGLRGPEFNGYYFTIGELGGWWKLRNNLPGKIGVGAWGQTGLLKASGKEGMSISEHGAEGFYLFATQRLWYQHPGKDSNGIIGFIQYGFNNSITLSMNEYYGGGLTFLGLLPPTISDSFGWGFALAKLNHREFERRYELILQAYNRTPLCKDLYLLCAMSCIPKPGALPPPGTQFLPCAWAGTARIIALF